MKYKHKLLPKLKDKVILVTEGKTSFRKSYTEFLIKIFQKKSKDFFSSFEQKFYNMMAELKNGKKYASLLET